MGGNGESSKGNAARTRPDRRGPPDAPADPADPEAALEPSPDGIVARERSEASPGITRFIVGDPLWKPSRTVELQRFSLIEVDNGYAFPIHRQKLQEIMIPLSGTYRCALNGREVAIGRGEGLLIEPGDMHEDRVENRISLLCVIFAIAGASGGERYHRLLAPPNGTETTPERRIFRMAEAEDWVRLLRNRLPETAGEAALRREEWSALGVALVWRAVEALHDRLSAELLEQLGQTAFHREVARVFRERLNRPPSTDELARELGLSRRGLEVKFKRLLGATPARAYAAYRIGHARELLISGMAPKDVAWALGFANQSHFARVFKKYAGAKASTLR